MNPRTSRPALGAGALALALALLVGACSSSGSSDDAKKDEASTTAVEATTTSASSAGPGPEDERAATVNLEEADFPEAWDVVAFEDGADTYRPVSGCVPAFAVGGDGQPGSFSTDYFVLGSLDQGDGAQLMADTVVFEDAAAATEAVSAFEDPEVVACLDDAVRSRFADTTGLDVEGSLEASSPDVGAEQAVQVSGDLTLTSDDGAPVDGSVSLVALRTGEVATVVTTVAFGGTFDAEDSEAAIAKLATLQGP